MSDLSDDEEKIRRALTISLVVGLSFVLLIGAIFWALDAPRTEDRFTERQQAGPKSVEEIVTPEMRFTEVTAAAGIDFVHVNGATGDRLLPETMGGGAAFFDYDNDGHEDLFLVNSAEWSGGETATSRLYRNRGKGSFEDVSAATGMDISIYGMGVAVADFDADGWVDVFVTAVGENKLLKNDGGKRFIDVTDDYGVAGAGDAWSTSAAFLDYDRDGDLDLFVANYVRWSFEIDRQINYQIAGLGRAYGPPTDFAGTHAYLYRNDGSRFMDVSREAGMQVVNEATGEPVGKGLAIIPLDVDDDGWLDVAVANDTVRNFLFMNQRDGAFAEQAIERGLAFDPAGLATGAMGIDAANFENDDKLAIAIGNFANEMSSFYVLRGGEGVFSDDSIVSGIGAPSRKALSFGVVFADLDLDGRVDVAAANGHVEPDINKVQASQRYEQPVQLFWNCGDRCRRTYRLVEPAVGRPIAGRGLTYADIDQDGDLDLLATAVGDRPMLLRNDSEARDYVRLRLRQHGSNPNAIGAVVRLHGETWTQTRTVMPTRSYLSQVELPVTFGLPDSSALYAEVRWPDGALERIDDILRNRLQTITRTRD